MDPRDMSDPTEAARALEAASRAAADNAVHLALAAVGIGAAVLRLATYTGPARPWRVVLLDGAVMLVVGFGVSEAAMGLTSNVHLTIGVGLASGLIGWETVKRVAASRAAKEG